MAKEMKKEQGSRWFLIQHKNCGCTIINDRKFIKRCDETNVNNQIMPPVKCPSCGNSGTGTLLLKNFLLAYIELYESLATNDFTITEIPLANLDYESLRQFLVTKKPE